MEDVISSKEAQVEATLVADDLVVAPESAPQPEENNDAGTNVPSVPANELEVPAVSAPTIAAVEEQAVIADEIIHIVENTSAADSSGKRYSLKCL